MVPPRPKFAPLYLEEIFRSRQYRQDFRRFLVKHSVVAPLQFLEAASGLKYFKDGSEKQLAHAQKIHKKFFGKEAQFGKLLQCNDKTIHLIAGAESISPLFVLAAFMPVYRSLEKVWFKKYLKTFRGNIPEIRSAEVSPAETEIEKHRRSFQPTEVGDNIPHSQRTLKKLVQFIFKLQSTAVHKQMIDYVRILCEEEIEQIKAVIRPRIKGGKKETEKFEEGISDLKKGDLPNLELRILFLHDLIQYKTLFNCLHQIGGVFNEKHSLFKKANFIIRRYLIPETDDYWLLGVPEKLLVEARMSFRREGPTGTLFHEITLALLPPIFKIWKSMWIECTKCGGKAAFVNVIKQKQLNLSSEETLQMLNNLKKETIIPTNDCHVQVITLSFSLQKGIRVFVPKQSAPKEEKVYYRHPPKAQKDSDRPTTESVVDVRGGSRLGYVLIK